MDPLSGLVITSILYGSLGKMSCTAMSFHQCENQQLHEVAVCMHYQTKCLLS